ncbi:Fe-S cluster assembly ATPase SufC [Clostridium sp. C105KSO13]|uniref:Fe-S cluster assembly ATPase SufC n=1 Tax=Clostridium sp. C105KSO13 TaxID=1776045 RepID=UPI00074084F9|nr:Fe-S cluster assembly ATPase SufC [Clostridium sp. C105KSO13]CUX21664.1 Vegetative protein 296 [Clostridium sp. C105KSO13]
MGSTLLEIQDLGVSVEGHAILEGVNLKIDKGEIHVLMGPNGTGKSTLVSSIMGDPRYEVTKGKILFNGKNITDEKTDERARKGIFLSFQAPEEIPGITLENFLRTAKGVVEGRPPKVLAFRKELKTQMEALDMDPSYAKRYLNVGFSGGEKKKAEILQLLMLQPQLALLDETDSGLDVDAVRTVSKGISTYHNQKNAVLIITHSAKILEGLNIDYVHILEGGHIIKSGGRELASEIIESGFGRMEEGTD